MSREWKAGDVAMVRFVNGASEHRAMRDADGKGWGVVSHAGSLQVADARPLVVIDPDDREQVERFTQTWREVEGVEFTDEPWTVDGLRMQAALRAFADPKPRIEEPTGLGAVAADLEDEWVHIGNGCWFKTVPNAQLLQRSWSDFSNAVTVLSEGVTP